MLASKYNMERARVIGEDVPGGEGQDGRGREFGEYSAQDDFHGGRHPWRALT